MKKYIDISRSIFNDMSLYPGNPSTKIDNFKPYEKGCTRTSALSMCLHSGTHLDTPAHILEKGEGVEAFAWEDLIGPCVVLRFDEDVEEIGGVELERFWNELAPEKPFPIESKILLHTKSSRTMPDDSSAFDPNYAYLNAEAAEFLISKKTRLVGTDAPSIQKYKAEQTVHHLTIRNMIVLEGLIFSEESGFYQLITMPLRIPGADGSPARCILIQD